jgi:ribosomal protein S7
MIAKEKTSTQPLSNRIAEELILAHKNQVHCINYFL